jgi:Caspase domain
MQLRSILVGDTLDAAIGRGIIANLRNLESFLRALELDGKIGVSKVEIKGNDFNCKSINEAVAQLAVDATDAVLFYYSGHGFRRDSTQSQFPEFDCMRTSDPDRAGLKTIADDLVKTKKPKISFGHRRHLQQADRGLHSGSAEGLCACRETGRSSTVNRRL